MYEKFAKNELKNNLFEYATSELSQDAFICWLASYAHEEAEKDAALNECARKMLEMFVPEFEGKNFKLLNVERQVDKIDVLLTVECEKKVYKIIVEDKTYTSEHDNQLKRYVDGLAEKHEENTVIVKGVYYKTGFQSDLSSVEDAHYEIISREKMLNLMQQYVDKTNNQIFISYYNYWNSKQNLVETFKTLPVVDWSWWAVYGFYDYLHKELQGKKLGSWYGYVANPSGGFHALSVWVLDNEDRIYLNNENKVIVDKEKLKKYNDADKQNEKVDETFKYKYSFYFHIRTTLKNGKIKAIIVDWKIENYLKVNESNSLTKEERRKLYKEMRDEFIKLLENNNVKLEKISRIGNGKCVTLGSICLDKNGNYENLKEEIFNISDKYNEILKKIKN